jgi:hypothetical protein
MNQLQTIQQKLIAPKGQFNSFGKYKYRNCEDILEAVKPHLAETKTALTLSDRILEAGGRIYVEALATLFAEDGSIIAQVTAYAREEESKKGMDSSQLTGATSSYARKYALNGLFCIDDVKDADSRDNSTEKPLKNANPAQASEPSVDLLKQAIDRIDNAKNLEELKFVFLSLPPELKANPEIVAHKDEAKRIFDENA